MASALNVRQADSGAHASVLLPSSVVLKVFDLRMPLLSFCIKSNDTFCIKTFCVKSNNIFPKCSNKWTLFYIFTKFLNVWLRLDIPICCNMLILL